MVAEELQNGRYRRIRLLGSGGMGEVYLMDDTRVSRQVAIKVIRSESAPYPDSDSAKDAARLFQREARAIAALDHPNILPLYDFGEEIVDGTTLTYMVMPLSTEGSLVNWLQQRSSTNTLSVQDVAHVVEQAADALQYAHDHYVIHLDVKTSNFLLRQNSRKANRPTLLLADFGIARNSATVASSSRTIRGTPTSMAPEQWSSQPSPATDQYALAVMAYEMLAGRPPFIGSMEQLMYQHFQVQPPPPSSFNTELSAEIDTVLLRALAKKPEDRFPSIAAFASAFEQAISTLPAGLTLRRRKSGSDDNTSDLRTTMAVSPSEAEAGISRMITLPGGQHINVTVPSGTRDGQVISVQSLDESSNPLGVYVTIAVKYTEEALPSSDSSRESDSISLGATLPTPDSSLMASQKSVDSMQKSSKVQESFDPALDHNLPTLATSGDNLQAPEKQQQQTLPKKQPTRPSRSVVIASSLIVLVLLVIASISGLFLFTNHQANIDAIAHSQTATASTHLVQAVTQTPGVTITVPPTPTAQKSSHYIAGTYKGTMTSEVTQQTTQITLFIGQSRGLAALSGQAAVGSSNSTAYTLTGTIDNQGNFSITVQQAAGQTPLVFYGTDKQDGYLIGNFCNSSTHTCSAGTGYFSVGPKI